MAATKDTKIKSKLDDREKEKDKKERIKKNGNSLCVILDKRVLNKVYNMDDGSEVKVTYHFPQIIIEGA